MKIVIKELTKFSEIATTFPLLKQRYPELSKKSFDAKIKEMIKLNNFKMIAAFANKEMVGVCGYWMAMMLYCGRYIQLSSFFVDEKSRSLGVGKEILTYLENKAKKLKCEKLVLDSNVENKKSHPLYFRENFYIRGYHFMKDL